MVSRGTKAEPYGRIASDYAAYDMHIDNALAMNKRISIFENTCYFAYPCSSSILNPAGSCEPNPDITEGMFMKSAMLMSMHSGSIPVLYNVSDGKP